jgi:putative ubiquitin-RnfH superfamily antitoxin RatB of RatAB toxin-antitoxin module
MVNPLKVDLIFFPQGQSTPIQMNFEVAQGTTVFDVIELSQLTTKFPEIANLKVGIFSKLVSHETLIRNGDRVEIYQPLKLDPKEQRRQKALKRK